MDRKFRERLHHFVELAMEEDLGEGDHTTQSTVSPTQSGEAKLLVKEAGILAGVEVGLAIIHHIDSSMQVDVLHQDGDRVVVGDVVLYMRGTIHAILKIERLLLNVMQRMSGIATRTQSYVTLLSDTKARVLDTRKTTPGIRFLEKEAVRIGGGANHRFGLYDMILIKDNHVDYAGGITAALERAFAYRQNHQLTIPIEIEVRSMEELEDVLHVSEKVDRVMLDNFTPSQTKDAVQLIAGRLITESSGGITIDTIRDYALAGVDFISVGALTHSVKSLDLSLKAKLI